MILTRAIEKESENWLDCRETSANRSKCVDEIQSSFGLKGEAWCAMFIWKVTENACKKLGVPNPLFKSASTAQMLANTDLRKDNKPAKGAIFYRERYENGKKSGGHVGFVTKVEGGTIHTIEGNTNSGGIEGVFRQKNDTTKQKYQFIHIEDLDTLENNINSILEPFNLNLNDKKLYLVLGCGAATVAGFAIFKSKKIRKH